MEITLVVTIRKNGKQKHSSASQLEECSQKTIPKTMRHISCGISLFLLLLYWYLLAKSRNFQRKEQTKNDKKKPRGIKLRGLNIFHYLFENCGARLAFFRPYFFLSFIRGSLVKKPLVFKVGLYSPFACNSALEIPWRIAPA